METILNSQVLKQVPFLLLALACNVLSGSLAAKEDFTWKIFFSGIKTKLIIFSIAIGALLSFTYFPVDGKPLYEIETSLIYVDFGVNIFKTMNIVCFIYWGVGEILSTNENLINGYKWHLLPPVIAEPFKKFYGWDKSPKVE